MVIRKSFSLWIDYRGDVTWRGLGKGWRDREKEQLGKVEKDVEIIQTGREGGRRRHNENLTM